MQISPIDWIFFDCFNTLIDDFDEDGDESGLGSVRHIPVDAGWYSTPEEFRRDYDAWHERQWPHKGWQEVELPERLRAVFGSRMPGRAGEIDPVVSRMVKALRVGYASTLRLTPGVREMLDFWYGRCRMGVVSNFYFPGWPAGYIEVFGLSRYFDFVLDSAAFGWKKPGLQIYGEALRLSGVPPSKAHRVQFIGDSLRNDVLSPRQVGMQAVYFDRSKDRPSSSRAPEGIPSITHWDQFRMNPLQA